MDARFLIRSALAPAAALALGLAATQAGAHARLVASTPAADAAVAAPRQIALHFSEALAAPFSAFDVVRTDGGRIGVTTTFPKTDHRTMVGEVAAPLLAGRYRVVWHAVASDDGHRTQGEFAFTVR
jgi:methionine-rich copper-binding protein CopC